MFGKIASDALGLSDIGIIVSPKDFHTVDADDYLFHEDGEKIFFLIKSRKDEYCFTNFGMVHVDGESAVSAKRAIRRYDFSSYLVTDVFIETAGTLDRDVELKFRLGDHSFSIDVKKGFIEQLKDIYKALHSIGKLQGRDVVSREIALRVLDANASMYRIAQLADPHAAVDTFRALLSETNRSVLDIHTRKDFGDIFQKYIHD